MHFFVFCKLETIMRLCIVIQKVTKIKNLMINLETDAKINEISSIKHQTDNNWQLYQTYISAFKLFSLFIIFLLNSRYSVYFIYHPDCTRMNYSYEQFNEIMISKKFKNNKSFKSNPKNLLRIIDYIERMPINQNSFEVVEYLIKEFGVAILYSFQPFYKRIINDQEAQKKYEPQLQRISALALYMINFGKYGQLKFFSIAGTAKKGFKLKQKTPNELEFIQDLDFIRKCLILKKENPQLESLPKDSFQKLVLIKQKVQHQKHNPFMSFYINKMIENLNNQFESKQIQGSNANKKLQKQDFKKKQNPSPTVDCATLPFQIKFQCVKKQESNSHLETTREQSEQFTTTGTRVNFAVIPLCCRTYFFDCERILPTENKRTEYKSYRFPFNPASIETFKKTICAFLNTIGGQIYIGIKQTTNKKYRYALGIQLTENDKEEVLKQFRKISESIYPNIQGGFKVEFVPVRQSPLPQLNFLNQIETYYYDFSKKELRLENCPFKQAIYVIRVRVPMGGREEMYSYVQTQYQLNKNFRSNEFISFRSENEILVKEISQEVLKQFRKKLINGNSKICKIHKGKCKNPQLGNARNESPQQMIDSKQKQTSKINQKQKNLQDKLLCQIKQKNESNFF